MLNLYRRALRDNPNSAVALRGLADTLTFQGKLDEALPYIRRAVQVQPNDGRLRIRAGELLSAGGQDAEATEHLLMAVRIMPEHPGAYYLLGIQKNKSGDVAAAKKHLKQALEVGPDFADAYLVLSIIARQERDHDAAEQILRDGLKNAPEAPVLTNALAWTLATHSDPARRNGAEAVRLAETACERTGHANPGFLDTLAAAYAEQGRFEEAVKIMRDAIKRATEANRAASAEAFKARLALYQAGSPYHEDE